NQNWQEDSILASMKINSFDQVFVRKNPLFELQESVYVFGEVTTPGEYNKSSKAERISSLVARSGGITDLAYLKGAFVMRPLIGKMSIKLDKALRRRGSKFDIPLLVGDTLIVPPRTDVVRIIGNVLQPGTVILYDPGNRRFKHYVRLAGGYDRRTKKKKSTVSYVNGRVKGVRSFLFFRKYPKMEQGAVIRIARKPDKESREPGEKQRISFQEVLATATSILTFWVLL
ncbi:MAG: hypothetical protein KDE26_31860, partial [Bacteroidetes bacterium]|nr:hypothetical protein [Bacteroidota bacterium]